MVDELIATDSQEGIDDLLLYRYHPDHQGGLGMAGAAAYWLYRMVNTGGPSTRRCPSSGTLSSPRATRR